MDNLPTLGARLKWALKQADATQKELADFLEIKPSAVSQWVNDETRPSRPDRIEAFFQTKENIDFLVTPWWLYHGGILPQRFSPGEIQMDNYVVVPTLELEESDAAELSLDFKENNNGFAFGKEWINNLGLSDHTLEVVKATGKSMEPTIFEGNVLLIDRTDSTPSPMRSKIYVVKYDNIAMIKRVNVQPDGYLLESDNPDKREYKDIFVPTSPANTLLPTFKVLGRVIWRGGTL